MAAESLNPRSVEFIYDETKAGTESQMRDVEALDAKTVQVFAAASVVIGLASFTGTEGEGWVTLLLLLALISYGLALFATACALAVRSYFKAPYTNTLWEDFYDLPPEQIKHSLVTGAAEGFKRNSQQISTKADWTQRAIYATGAESALVGLALIMARVF